MHIRPSGESWDKIGQNKDIFTYSDIEEFREQVVKARSLEDEFYNIVKLSYITSSDGKKQMQVGLARADSGGAYYHIIFDGCDSERLDGKPDKVLKMHLSLSEMLKLKKLFDEGEYSGLEMIAEKYKDKETAPDKQSLRFYDEIIRNMF